MYKMAFRSFNESTRLKLSTLKHGSIFVGLHQLGADLMYATNSNRKYLTEKQVFTGFPKKGPKSDGKPEKKLRSLIATLRATVMEGSFGTHKTAYGLDKIKAKGEKREYLWVFFGVMTANVVKMAKRADRGSPFLKQAA